MPRAPRHPRTSPRTATRTPSGRQPESISARENHWLKRFRVALAGAPSSGEISIGVEGVRLVEEALRSNIKVEAILVSESGRKHLGKIIPRIGRETRLLATSDALFQSIAGTETTQGVAAIVWPPRATLDDLYGGNNPTGSPVKANNSTLIVVLVGLQDPGNVGTILRTAEALGATGVAACRSNTIGTAHIFSPQVLQTQMRTAGVRMLAATSTGDDSAVTPWQADLCGPVAIFIGNEGAGLPPEVIQAADLHVRIPLAMARGIETESVESLNAGSAAAILLYEAACQRGDSASNKNE
jgi:TrmH family RNA methyltransferase